MERVQTKQVQDRRLQIVHVHRIPSHGVAKLIRLAESDPVIQPTAGHPDSEAVRMMIAAKEF